jgi:thiamine pyrophosphate-dependent acetolactate synthase large subunit-like protein
MGSAMGNGSDLLVASLVIEGVEPIFGVPGENPDVVESLRQSSIKSQPWIGRSRATASAASINEMSGS